MLRNLLSLFLALSLTVAADVPWGDDVVMRVGGHRKLPGGVQLHLVGVGEGATLALGRISRRVQPGETMVVGSYRVYLVSIGDDKCVVKWVRTPSVDQATELLESYGWQKIDGTSQQLTVDLSADLDGPAAEYQKASRRIGLDLRPVAGKKTILRRYRLREVANSSKEIYAYLAISPEGQVVGAWLAPEGASDANVAALDQRALLQW